MERMDKNTRLPLGTRDACHIPFVVGRLKDPPIPKDEEARKDYYKQWEENRKKYVPGAWVKFTDDKFTYFELCEKVEAHGFINPLLETVSTYDNVIIWLMPDITEPVRHTFEICPNKRQTEKSLLEEELAEAQANDPECASCWDIVNGEVIRW